MQIAGYEITDGEYRALAYILVDPDAWIEHAAKQRKGAEAITHKIEKALALVTDVPEGEYTTRAEREAMLEAKMETEVEAQAEKAHKQVKAIERLRADPKMADVVEALGA